MTEKKTQVEDKQVPEKKAPEKKVTEAEKIWNEIVDCQLEMFSLPDQTVRKYCSPVTIEPSKLYITASVQAVVPALETAIGKKFDIEMATKYIIISRKKD
jgi:hypothetical protein